MIEQARNFYENLERRERIILISSVIASFIALIGVLVWANMESYKTVYTSSDSSRVQTAAMALDAADIPYKISEDGFKLRVPVEHLGQARVTTAGTSSVSGMEVLDNMKLGVSPQQERWIYINALQGELTKTINSLEEVAASRVHIVEAEPSAFLKREDQSSASVTVRLHPGQKLSNAQVQGITSLVAGAVRGLKPKQVVLIDETGELLNGNPDGNGDMALANTLVEARKNHENRYKNTILRHLLPIVGSSNDVSVAVTVDVVAEAKETLTHSRDPDSQVTMSETIKESSSKDETPVGIPGSESNLPEQTPAAEEASSDEKFQSATNYEYSQVKETIVLAPGAPQKVNASVLVNTVALQNLIDSSGGDLSMADLQKEIQTAVQAAIGYSSKRGDTVEVSYVPFKPLSTDGNLASSALVSDWERYINYALMLLVIILIFLFIVRPLVNTYNDAVIKANEPELTAEQLAALEDADGSSIAMARRLRRMVDNFETIDSQELNHLVEMHEQPTAEVLRRWLRAS